MSLPFAAFLCVSLPLFLLLPSVCAWSGGGRLRGILCLVASSCGCLPSGLLLLCPGLVCDSVGGQRLVPLVFDLSLFAGDRLLGVGAFAFLLPLSRRCLPGWIPCSPRRWGSLLLGFASACSLLFCSFWCWWCPCCLSLPSCGCPAPLLRLQFVSWCGDPCSC